MEGLPKSHNILLFCSNFGETILFEQKFVLGPAKKKTTPNNEKQAAEGLVPTERDMNADGCGDCSEGPFP